MSDQTVNKSVMYGLGQHLATNKQDVIDLLTSSGVDVDSYYDDIDLVEVLGIARKRF